MYGISIENFCQAFWPRFVFRQCTNSQGTPSSRFLWSDVKIFHSLNAVGAQQMKGGALSSLFAALFIPDSKNVLIYCWIDRQNFPVVCLQSIALNSQPFLHHCQAALTPGLWCLSSGNCPSKQNKTGGELKRAKQTSSRDHSDPEVVILNIV